ncbi:MULTISPECIES: TMEM14 family protein [Crocosphaera]|uniref:Uncharacterized protein n=2 Tax=Crocosphaera watsonii TaxID=263511 RepID=T2JRU7_CROWT|nr:MULTISPECIES: TMEM14 family protein [Crocosphaera]CCQ60176.1 hypothetical protein CWATWH0401_1752 [Crocosphaera watsonii WH 0401]CCQ68588.1 hypothetical protein CWATWH0402_6122 [Crocosphaera watsonii WH 0402]
MGIATPKSCDVAIRLWKTRKFMPAGLMLVLSVATLVILSIG